MRRVAEDVVYNGLRSAEPSLPSTWYFDSAHHAREISRIWHRNWLMAGRSDIIASPRSYRTFEIGGQSILIIRNEHGRLNAFENVCRHRGSVLCQEAQGRLGANLISCPYHRWGYDLSGALVRTPSIAWGEGFDPGALSLYPVAVAEWRGFIFVNLAGETERTDVETVFQYDDERLDNWPLEQLVTGHRFQTTLACNWKVFWENFNECLHCPGIHPELCDLVPIYGRAIMAERDDPNWASREGADPKFRGGLKPGATTWSMDGKAAGLTFSGLTPAEAARGATYSTAYPSAFIVAHVDYVRTVALRPLGPEATELTAEWLFLPEALERPGFDLANVVDFATLVLHQDATACELNQMGLRARSHRAGVLMPEEYAVHAFHKWVRRELGD